MPSAGATIGCPYTAPISIPEWNAPSPLKGSIRSPNDPVTGPSTGQRFGEELARTQSAVVTLRVSPRVSPAVVAPLNAVVFKVYSRSIEELTCSSGTLSGEAAVTSTGSGFKP